MKTKNDSNLLKLVIKLMYEQTLLKNQNKQLKNKLYEYERNKV